MIVFKSFSYEYDNLEWIQSLQEGENAECVAIGNFWCAVATDFHNIRVYSHNGLEISCISYEKPIISMFGYENHLAIIYHDGVPILGCQSMKIRIYDIEDMTIYYECGCPITPYSNLTWCGYSEEGLIFC